MIFKGIVEIQERFVFLKKSLFSVLVTHQKTFKGVNTVEYRIGWEISQNQSLNSEEEKIIFELNYEQISIQLILKRKVKTLSALTRLLNKDEGTFFCM